MTRHLPFLLLGAGLVLWVWSLFLPVFFPSDFRPPAHYDRPWNGFETFVSGVRGWWLCPFLPWLWGWYANPLMLVALAGAAFGWRGVAAFFSLAAVLLAQTAWLNFFFHAQATNDLAFPALTGGSTGFFVWDVALGLMFAGIWTLFWRRLPD